MLGLLTVIMNQNRNIMKKLLIISLVLLISAITQAQEKSFLDINYVEVTTKADREVVPDKIYLSVTISEKENKGKISVEKQEKEMIGMTYFKS